MSDTPSIRTIKHTAYKGGTKQWSNRYHFSGGQPSDLTHWTALAAAVVAAEKLCMANTCGFDQWVAYGPGSDLPLFSGTLTGTGALSGGGSDVEAPLEVCALVRWDTDQRSSKNHAIYLYSYIHAVILQGSAGAEKVQAAQLALLNTYATAWVSGFSDGVNTYKRAGPRGAVAQAGHAEQYSTHRDFPTRH